MERLLHRIKVIAYPQATWYQHILVALLFLVTYLLLIPIRSLDNNMLTAWRWVFTSVDQNQILLFLALGIFAAYIFSRVSLAPRYYAPFLFASSFLLTALFWRSPEIIVDASRYFTQAKHLEVYGVTYFIIEWGHGISAWTDLPLVPFLYGLLFSILGESRIVIQLFVGVLFASTVVITYKIGKSLWNEETGFYGGLLLLGIPYIFSQIPLMLVDIPTMFFLTLAIFTFIQVFERGGMRTIVFSSIAIFLACFSKYSTWPMLSVFAVILVVYLFKRGEPSESRANGRFRITTAQNHLFLCSAAAVALISAAFIGIVLYLKLDVILEQFNLLINYQSPGLRRWGESFYSTFLFQVHPIITIASVYSAYVAIKRRDLKYAIIAWLVLLMLIMRIERIRYIIPIFPMITLMAAYGLQDIKGYDLRKFILACAVISSLVIAVFAYSPFLQKISAVNLKEAGKYVASLHVERIEVITPALKNSPDINPATSVPLLDLFVDQDISYRYLCTSPPQEKIKTSPLKFTWEYENPEYYEAAKDRAEASHAVVVISDSMNPSLESDIKEYLNGYRLSKVFNTSEGIFKYQTVVSVYEPVDTSGKHDSR